MTLDYTARPLSDKTWLRPNHEREGSRFTASWSDTQELLDREVRMIDGGHLVIGIDVREQDFRIDGRLRANARPVATSAVEVALDSRHGPLLYRCDQYGYLPYRNRMELWQHNVRAVALTLEALRAVDRYGASRSGEQYRGYKAIGAGTGLGGSTGMTTSDAAAILLRVAGLVYEPTREVVTALGGARLVRLARAATHPDRHGGDTGQWHLVDNAVQTLQRAGWLPKELQS